MYVTGHELKEGCCRLIRVGTSQQLVPFSEAHSPYMFNVHAHKAKPPWLSHYCINIAVAVSQQSAVLGYFVLIVNELCLAKCPCRASCSALLVVNVFLLNL